MSSPPAPAAWSAPYAPPPRPHDQAAGPQPGQHPVPQHRGRDGVHHRVKGRGQPGQSRQRGSPQAKALGQSTLLRPSGTNGHPGPQRRQPHGQCLPHRPEPQHQHLRTPQGTGALLQQDADAALCRGDGVVHGQFRPGKVVCQFHPGLPGDLHRLRRQPPAQRKSPRFGRPQQLCQRGAALIQRQRKQDHIRPGHLLGPGHRIACPGQRAACCRLPGITAHHRDPFSALHAAVPPPLCCAPSYAIVLFMVTERFEMPSAHALGINSGKIFYHCKLRQSAACRSLPFHGWGRAGQQKRDRRASFAQQSLSSSIRFSDAPP